MTTADDALQELQLAIRGPVISADDAEYEDLRHVWNRMIDRQARLHRALHRRRRRDQRQVPGNLFRLNANILPSR